MKNLKYHLSLIAANLMLGANYSFYSSLIGHDISSEGLYVLRTLSTALFFAPAMFLSQRWRVSARDLGRFGLVTLLLVFGRQYVMLQGMNYTSPIDGSIIATTGPILIMIISAIAIKEQITRTRTVGILLGAVGATVLIVSNMHGGSVSGKMWGNVLLLISILFSALNTVFVKGLFNHYSPYTVIGWSYLIGALVVVPVFGKQLTQINIAHWTPQVYGSMIYVLGAGTVLSSVLLFFGLKGVSATASSVYVYTQPVIATLLAVVRGQDKITAITLVSAALIFSGVFFVIRSYKTQPVNAPHIE